MEESDDCDHHDGMVISYYRSGYKILNAKAERLEKELESERTMRAKLEKQLSEKSQEPRVGNCRGVEGLTRLCISKHFAHPSQEFEEPSEPLKKTDGQNANQIEPKNREEDEFKDDQEDQISALPKKQYDVTKWR